MAKRPELCPEDKALGDYLVQAGVLDEHARERASTLCEGGARQFAPVLLDLGLIGERNLTEAFSACFGWEIASHGVMQKARTDITLLPSRFLRKTQVLPIEEDEQRLVVAMANPGDKQVRKAIEMAVGKPVKIMVAERTEVERTLSELFEADDERGLGFEGTNDDTVALTDDIAMLKELASEAPVVKTVNGIIDRAVELRASDIHIEPFRHRLGLRYRIDGRLVQQGDLPSTQAAALISRVKILAKLDIAERRLPQDGRTRATVRGRSIDLRVSTMPTAFGESVVIRILDREAVCLEFGSLGLTEANQTKLMGILNKPNGIVLVTGPTGSGKTTTLYTALSQISTPDVNIVTVEDPVEYQLPGIKQVQVKPNIGLGFASVLRSILRHDPDVILIGEIRDLETAEIAVQAAFTGHLVLSSLHTNDAAASLTRLIDMGLKSYQLNSSINAVVAQRLVRRLCPDCKVLAAPNPSLAADLGIANSPVYAASGCSSCLQSGYLGRMAITEIMPMGAPISQALLEGADASHLHRAACQSGMRTLLEDGLHKVLEGETSIEEVLAVTGTADTYSAPRTARQPGS